MLGMIAFSRKSLAGNTFGQLSSGRRDAIKRHLMANEAARMRVIAYSCGRCMRETRRINT
jgi:hypothetical protein